MAALGPVPRASARGARCARTTAPTATRGATSPTTTRARARTAGTRTGSPGICDDQQRLCFALAFWNGRDPILKERIFGLTGPQGNHGEDAKEYWWYLDSTPTHSWMRWRYMYPQARVPLRAARRRRTPTAASDEPEFELLDTGVFDDGRYWEITVDYAKAAPEDILIARHRRATPAPTRATLARPADAVVPQHVVVGTTTPRAVDRARRRRARRGARRRSARDDPDGDGRPDAAVLRQRDERDAAVRRRPAPTPYPKDGINDHVVHGAADRQPGAAPGRRPRCTTGSRSPPGATRRRSRLRLRRAGAGARRRLRRRSMPTARARGRRVLRRARRRPASTATRRRPAPGARRDALVQAVLPLRRRGAGSTATRPTRRRRPRGGTAATTSWPHLEQPRRHLDAGHVGVPVVRRVGPRLPLRRARARRPGVREGSSCILLCREWYMHPNGQLPAYEWAFGDVNPPVHAWAALRVFEIDGDERLRLPRAGLPQAAAQLHLVGEPQGRRRATTCSRAASSGSTTSARSTARALPVGGRARAVRRHGVDGDVLPEPAGDRARASPSTTRRYEDMATKFFEHFALIAAALNEQGPVGRGGRLLLRRAAARRRQRASRCGRARWSGCCRSPR